MSNTEWTNSEASRSKLALSQLGYVSDRFVSHFCSTPLKRAPEINRGYFARVHSIAHSARTFCLLEGARAQIVNIGAGFDTLFWRLQSDPEIEFSRFVEIDCNEVIEHKIRAIQKSEELLQLCGPVKQFSVNSFHSSKYHALAQDATKAIQLIEKLTKKCDLSKEEPVLFIFECVLLYWHTDSSTNLIYLLNKSFSKCNFVVFDLVNTQDKFAQVMQQSLSEHETPLLGAVSTRTLDDWKQKFLNTGSKYCKTWLMAEVYDKLIDRIEILRIEKIEFLDEIELLSQLFNHYCLVYASNYRDFTW